ncbi:MAG TPA: ribosome maturation factor RimM, partial [Anaerolineales bacterium]
GEEHKPVELTSVRPHAKGMLVKFKGIEGPEEAGQLRNQWVYVKASDVPSLPEGKLYQHELFGFEVVDESGNALGQLVEILETGANDVYVVRNEAGKEILLPAIPSVILEVDSARRVMRVHVLEGL